MLLSLLFLFLLFVFLTLPLLLALFATFLVVAVDHVILLLPSLSLDPIDCKIVVTITP